MSGIFGLINLDGRPAAPEHFRAMEDEMAKWGPDGVGTTFLKNAAFGHALLVVTHESRYEVMPRYDHNEGILFTAAARLDNRDELCDVFGVSLSERPTTSDGQLVLKAYIKWGSESCKHIFGDWSFAAWNIKKQRLFLARDHIGNTGLFYHFKPPLIVFASNIEAVLSHPEVPRKLNEMHLAQRLVFDYLEKTWSQTYWTDVFSIPSSHAITFNRSSKQIEKYWRLDKAPAVRFASDTEYLEGFLDHFRRAVRVRLNSIRPIGTTLSAGLDSGSVTALAAEALCEDNRLLTAFTSVPLYPSEKLFSGRLTDEWPLAHSVAERYDNIEHIPIRAEDITALTAIKRSLSITQVPQHATANMVWIISLFENARCRHLGVMLTGQLGNGGVSWSGGRDYIFYLFAHNQWQKGLRALNALKMRQGFSWFRAMKSQLLRPVLLPLWSEYQSFCHPEKQINLFYPFFKKDFIERLGLYDKDKVNIEAECIEPLTERILTTIRNGIIVGPLWHAFGFYYNMEVRDPTADVRLLEFCMGVPNEQDTLEGGERMLIRRATADILPDSVRWNTIRGIQAADIQMRLINQRDELESEFARLGSAPEIVQYFDVQAMNNALRALLMPNSRLPAATVHAFLRAINTGYFLLSFSGRPTEFEIQP